MVDQRNIVPIAQERPRWKGHGALASSLHKKHVEVRTKVCHEGCNNTELRSVDLTIEAAEVVQASEARKKREQGTNVSRESLHRLISSYFCLDTTRKGHHATDRWRGSRCRTRRTDYST